jgi:hypothetical protein
MFLLASYCFLSPSPCPPDVCYSWWILSALSILQKVLYDYNAVLSDRLPCGTPRARDGVRDEVRNYVTVACVFVVQRLILNVMYVITNIHPQLYAEPSCACPQFAARIQLQPYTSCFWKMGHSLSLPPADIVDRPQEVRRFHRLMPGKTHNADLHGLSMLLRRASLRTPIKCT